MRDSARRAQALRISRAAEERAAKRQKLMNTVLLAAGDGASPVSGGTGPATHAKADGWVGQGVRKLAKTCPKNDHVVLMAATHEDSGKVGVGSSICCNTLVAMNALGRLVAELNDAFCRDGVEVKLSLRMTEHKEQV